MRKYFLSLMIILAAGGCAAPNNSGISIDVDIDINNSMVYAPDEVIEGKTLPEWSVYWWDWAYSTGAPGDTTGKDCASGQNFGVWFLAGSYGKEKISRHCVIPQGKTLIFPIINTISSSNASKSFIGCLCHEYETVGPSSRYRNLFLKINGVSYSDHLLQSYVEKKVCANRLGCERPLTSGGVYAALRPLPPGEYQIEFGGSGSGFSQDIVYTIQVE